jgi:hypothetical protein
LTRRSCVENPADRRAAIRLPSLSAQDGDSARQDDDAVATSFSKAIPTRVAGNPLREDVHNSPAAKLVIHCASAILQRIDWGQDSMLMLSIV